MTQSPPKPLSELVRELEVLRDEALEKSEAPIDRRTRMHSHWLGKHLAYEFAVQLVRDWMEQRRLWEHEHPEQ